jgi:hypothetical protein
MSKLQLKKELKQLTHEQLMELILDAYDARKEIKEYFEYFLAPDVKKLSEKYKVAISKELSRVKRGGYCKARISHIKSLLKEFASFQPGYEEEIDMMLFTIVYALISAESMYIADTLTNGIVDIMIKMIQLADRNYIADKTIARTNDILHSDDFANLRLSRTLRIQLRDIEIRPQLTY